MQSILVLVVELVILLKSLVHPVLVNTNYYAIGIKKHFSCALYKVQKPRIQQDHGKRKKKDKYNLHNNSLPMDALLL